MRIIKELLLPNGWKIVLIVAFFLSYELYNKGGLDPNGTFFYIIHFGLFKVQEITGLHFQAPHIFGFNPGEGKVYIVGYSANILYWYLLSSLSYVVILWIKNSWLIYVLWLTLFIALLYKIVSGALENPDPFLLFEKAMYLLLVAVLAWLLLLVLVRGGNKL